MRRFVALSFALSVSVALAACGGTTEAPPSGEGPSADAPAATADVGEAAEVTPVDDDVLAAAAEEGEVLLYVNAEDQQMAPVKEAFEAAHPEITLRSLTLGDDEAFQRYQSEVATGIASADLLMNHDTLGWLDFIEGGNVEPHEDPNAPNLPDFALLGPGVYAASADPVIAVFNKAMLPEDEQPTTMTALAEMAGEVGGIATTDISNAIQFGATTAYLAEHGEDAWEVLDALGTDAGVEASNGPLVTKLVQGQYSATFFVAGAVRAFITDDVAEVVNFRYLEDGTPLLPRAIAITSEAANPNAAKVFLNWLLSVEGQEAACTGGFTPYRDGVTCDFGLPQVIEEIGGEQNLIVGGLDPALAEEADDIIARWNEAFGR